MFSKLCSGDTSQAFFKVCDECSQVNQPSQCVDLGTLEECFIHDMLSFIRDFSQAFFKVCDECSKVNQPSL